MGDNDNLLAPVNIKLLSEPPDRIKMYFNQITWNQRAMPLPVEELDTGIIIHIG